MLSSIHQILKQRSRESLDRFQGRLVSYQSPENDYTAANVVARYGSAKDMVYQGEGMIPERVRELVINFSVGEAAGQVSNPAIGGKFIIDTGNGETETWTIESWDNTDTLSDDVGLRRAKCVRNIQTNGRIGKPRNV